jgi:hypothetical protein
MELLNRVFTPQILDNSASGYLVSKNPISQMLVRANPFSSPLEYRSRRRIILVATIAMNEMSKRTKMMLKTSAARLCELKWS